MTDPMDTAADSALRAERAAAILAVDTPVTDQGITFVAGDDAGCAMAMTVRSRQCNSHGICHGGITMLLADTAAAYALNTGEQSPRWVTSHSSSSLLAPGRAGEVLTATAEIGTGSGSSRIVDVRVTEPDGTVVVEMRNVMVRLRG
ncbi:hotdog fold thioesterase [Citricoccus sp.]|uniref:hotdog fold thioesterase n=1 Tax=Citricoccus sp. TaxID=1978372 RepID=UPI00260D3ADD|nr:hotdog fold thioesterase [Citricoccus sp.]HRO30976.1 hotdog fold thioesterase [Citricoccus sp.]